MTPLNDQYCNSKGSHSKPGLNQIFSDVKNHRGMDLRVPSSILLCWEVSEAEDFPPSLI